MLLTHLPWSLLMTALEKYVPRWPYNPYNDLPTAWLYKALDPFLPVGGISERIVHLKVTRDDLFEGWPQLRLDLTYAPEIVQCRDESRTLTSNGSVVELLAERVKASWIKVFLVILAGFRIPGGTPIEVDTSVQISFSMFQNAEHFNRICKVKWGSKKGISRL